MWQYNSELYHYGTLGMRWGHRRGGSYYRKQLNRNDQKSVNSLGRYMKLDVSGQLQTDKLDKYIKKHNARPTERNVAALRKMRIERDNTGEKRDSELSKLRAIDSDTNKLIAEILSKGYSVTSKEVIRSSERGREVVTAVLAGTAANVGSKAARYEQYKGRYPVTLNNGRVMNQTPWAIVGNKYRVHDSGTDIGTYTRKTIVK